MRVAASASWNSSAAVERFGSCRKYSIGRLSRSAMICSVRVVLAVRAANAITVDGGVRPDLAHQVAPVGQRREGVWPDLGNALGQVDPGGRRRKGDRDG